MFPKDGGEETSHRETHPVPNKGFSKLVPEAIEKYIDELEDHDRRVRDAISVLTNCDIWDVFRLLWLCNDIHYANIMIPISSGTLYTPVPNPFFGPLLE